MITLLSFGASAQETTSEIQGLVSDGKAGLPGVTVVAIHQPTGTKYNTSTRIDGRYNLPNLKSVDRTQLLFHSLVSKLKPKTMLHYYWGKHTNLILL